MHTLGDAGPGFAVFEKVGKWKSSTDSEELVFQAVRMQIR